MSGDIGKGTTNATIKFAQKVLQSELSGYVQLAGGTNNHTIYKLKQLHLAKGDRLHTNDPYVSGIAFGSYARKQLLPILEPEDYERPYRLEQDPDRLWQAVSHARALVNPLKS